ncbi:YitT family protein, partial [Bacillus haynesii]|nr:YitT family protein [Bacillus haynesii]
RTIIYLVFLTAGVMLKGPIGIGTLLTVCLGGLVLHFFMPFAGKVLGRFTDTRTLR